VKYAQQEGKRGLFLNMTTVLPLSGPVGLPKETFLGSAGRPPCRSRVPRESKWQDGGIIPAKICESGEKMYDTARKLDV
jgi:hypothetical protein